MKTECRSERFALHDKIYPCPLSVAMDLLGGKWKAVILYHLQDGPQRFTALRRLLSGATEAVLSRCLQQLEQDGLLSRQVFGEKPPLRTEYALTDFGCSVLPALNALLQWGNHVVTERGRFVD